MKKNKALKEAIKRLQDIEEDVTAFIILASTDTNVNIKNQDAVEGVNAVSGKGRDLCNLITNLPEDILEGVTLWMIHKGLKGK